MERYGQKETDAKMAQREEKIEKLKSSIQSLFHHMPALSFSKDMETGVYLACNQAFARYAGRETPAEVAGLTDYEIFDPVTAAHFVSDDAKAISMDTPYIFFEDVPDAHGDQRQFQTTKLKFTDETGRPCLLGMCMDVTEVIKARKENEQARTAYQEAMSTNAIYENIVDALFENYFNLYYVDVETDEYIEYGSRTEAGKRTTEKHGSDFFVQSRENAAVYLYEEDQEHFRTALDKERLLGKIQKHGAYTIQYRLMIEGVPTYVRMKATYVPGDERHMIIGISNVDSQVKDRIAAQRAEEERKTYMRLSALSGNLMVLYYVDPATDEYTEIGASRGYEDFGIAKQGYFFRTIYENSLKTVHPEDLPLFHSQVTKENILAAIERDGVFTLAYRLMNGDTPSYVRLKAVMVEEDGKHLLIVGLYDENTQIRQEQEYARDLSTARRMATVDSLTGVKNKHAYVEWEMKIDAQIKKGQQPPLAVVVCDINNLKMVNDLYGHKEGDICIQKACAKICRIFDHSPVFRTGGDEFVVLLSGEDYNRRLELMEAINYLPADQSKLRIGETIAAGMVEYDKTRHSSLLRVFEEADKAMYERKKLLKELCVPEVSRQDDSDTEVDPEALTLIHVRKQILIADDIETNREILGDLLKDDYDILYAGDGAEVMEVLQEYKDSISLVLLDLIMPHMTGREVIAQMQVDEDLMHIPVIVLTVDQEAELDSLKIGAMDFIPKPYPDINIVKTRIAKCIELSEDRDLIRHTERDKLTGLLNRDYFFRYAGRLDQIYRDASMDAVSFDVNRFHSINKHCGRQFGDLVLRSLGRSLRKLARETGGIVCREGGDTFLLYCPHQSGMELLLKDFLKEVSSEEEIKDTVSLRIGVFADAGRQADVEERFSRAKLAADRVKDDPEKICGFID